jgi:hypothetical protein
MPRLIRFVNGKNEENSQSFQESDRGAAEIRLISASKKIRCGSAPDPHPAHRILAGSRQDPDRVGHRVEQPPLVADNTMTERPKSVIASKKAQKKAPH